MRSILATLALARAAGAPEEIVARVRVAARAAQDAIRLLNSALAELASAIGEVH